jgi:hypothetical protein
VSLERVLLHALSLRMILSFTCEDNEEYGNCGGNKPDNNQYGWMSVLRDEGEHLSSITGCQECQKCVPDHSPQS